MAEPSLHATQVHHPFPAARYLPYLTSEDVAALDKEQAAVVLVVGAIEQHGPHLATGTDLILGASTLALAIERLDPSVQLWVLPPLPYSRSVEHTAFAGTFTLEQETLAAVVHDIGASVARSGFRRFVLYNSHGGNTTLLETVARDVRRRTGLMVFPFSMFRLGLTYPPHSDVEAAWGTHAGEWETSMMLHLTPELVDMERAQRAQGHATFAEPPEHIGLLGPIPFTWTTDDVSSSGAIGDPRPATVERGRDIVELSVAKIALALEEICRFEMPTPSGGSQSPAA
jgi:creatinine amidohydrolase/Fe(II)-dependent formamide hydrolase-like protein